MDEPDRETLNWNSVGLLPTKTSPAPSYPGLDRSQLVSPIALTLKVILSVYSSQTVNSMPESREQSLCTAF